MHNCRLDFVLLAILLLPSRNFKTTDKTPDLRPDWINQDNTQRENAGQEESRS
jgi:hypothetical protein